MPKQEGLETILIVVDKATKICYFLRCNKSISAKKLAALYWRHVGKLHGIPNAIISDRDPRSTGKFWKEPWWLLTTDLRLGYGYHPKSSDQVECFD